MMKVRISPLLETLIVSFIITGYTVDMLRQSKALWIMPKAGVKHIVHLGACVQMTPLLGIGRGISLWNVI
jgi:hypothetical protein